MFISTESHRLSYLQQCIDFEVKIGGKKCSFISLYRSVSQTKDELENSIKNVELNLEHTVNKSQFLIVVPKGLRSIWQHLNTF